MSTNEIQTIFKMAMLLLNQLTQHSAIAKQKQLVHPTVTIFITGIATYNISKPCSIKQHKQERSRCSTVILVLLFSAAVWLLDHFLWSRGAQRHFTFVDLILVPVWRLDGQIAADLESLVWLLNSGAGRDPTAHWTPIRHPGNICKTHRQQTGQTDQSGFVGLELLTGRREDCQDRRREGRAWTTWEH